MAFCWFSVHGDRRGGGCDAGTAHDALPPAGVLLPCKGIGPVPQVVHGTKLYQKHLESFVKDRSMTLKTKFSLLIPASCMLLLAFLAMSNIYGRVFIVFLIIFKYVYFFTRIRTVPEGQKNLPEAEV